MIGVFDVAKYLILSNEIRKFIGGKDSKCLQYCYNFFIGNKEFDNPLTRIRSNSRLAEPEAIKIQELVDDTEIQVQFLDWLDRIKEGEIKVLAEVKNLPKDINWKETTFGGGEKYIHLYFKNVFDYTCEECKIVRVLYTAFILIKYNQE